MRTQRTTTPRTITSPGRISEEWSALIADTQAGAAADVTAQPADLHWHHALHNSVHLH